MKSRRFLSAAVTASVLAAFAAPAALAAGSKDQTPVMPMSQSRHMSHLAEHAADQRADHVAGEMADPMAIEHTTMPGHVMMPGAPYEQTARALTPTELCKRYERRFDAAIDSHAQADWVDEARTLRIEGGKLCTSGEQARGAQKLREAMDYLRPNIDVE
jgi:hypothetical protein